MRWRVTSGAFCAAMADLTELVRYRTGSGAIRRVDCGTDGCRDGCGADELVICKSQDST